MDTINTTQQDQGQILLEDDSAEQVKKAIQQVSRIINLDGNKVTFEGQRIVEGHGFALRVNCYDIYQCPNGFLLHTYMDKGPNWAVTGRTLDELLAAAPDRSVARRAHGLLIQKSLISLHH